MLEGFADNVKSGGAVTVAVSEAESFPRLSSPPPATATLFVIVPVAVLAMAPVTVIAG